MTKAEVAQRLENRLGLSKSQSVAAVEEFLTSIKEAIKKRENVSLVGLGTFRINERAARQGRNPRTGEVLRIPRKRVVQFVPGKALREMVNETDSTP